MEKERENDAILLARARAWKRKLPCFGSLDAWSCTACLLQTQVLISIWRLQRERKGYIATCRTRIYVAFLPS